MNEDLKQLRKKMDSNDPFVAGGHQIKKIRRREREVPEWATNDKETQKLLIKTFPKLHTDKKQRCRAARWARLIHLFYRMKMTASQVAAEMKIPSIRVKLLLQGIRRVARGRRFDNRGPLGARPRGRPKKEK